MGSIFNVFGPSPIRPIEQHSRTVHECANKLYPFFEAVLAQDWPLASSIQKEIDQLETAADRIKRELRLHLPRGLFLPVSRTDLLELLTVQDKIANKAEDIAGLMLSRRMRIHPTLQSPLLSFLSRSLDASKQASKAINELDELLESGFRGSEVRIVEDMILVLDEIEHDCDTKLADVRQRIFALEQDTSAIEIVFMYKLAQWIGDLADHAQTVGGRLQILIAR